MQDSSPPLFVASGSPRRPGRDLGRRWDRCGQLFADPVAGFGSVFGQLAGSVDWNASPTAHSCSQTHSGRCCVYRANPAVSPIGADGTSLARSDHPPRERANADRARVRTNAGPDARCIGRPGPGQASGIGFTQKRPRHSAERGRGRRKEAGCRIQPARQGTTPSWLISLYPRLSTSQGAGIVLFLGVSLGPLKRDPRKFRGSVSKGTTCWWSRLVGW